MISEPRIVHKLWNILKESGYQVGGEVNVVPKEIYDEMSEFTITLNSKGTIVPTKKGAPTTIDLVITDGKKFTGFEVKDSFDQFGSGKIWKQLNAYAKGGMLDKIYAVIPKNISERVLGSYENSIRSRAGLWLMDKDYNFCEYFSSPCFQRSKEPKLKENEVCLRQKFWNYFESKFDVEGEGILPKPSSKMPQYKRVSNPKKFLQNIDLFLLPKDCTITEVASNPDKLDAIGIEIKYGITKSSLKKIINQLNSYACSDALTKLYLAIDKRDGWLEEKIKTIKDRKFGLLLYDKREVKTKLEATKLQMKYDTFAYMSPSGKRISVYEFGKPKRVKTFEGYFHDYYTTNGKEFFRDETEFFRNKLEFHRLIYARLSRRGRSHVIDSVSFNEGFT